ncbi:adenylyl-sulfate kinase [archaeon]|nr:adenylyl-sulfate kinase [archaeon]MBL7051293.1 adenylyl-sulfate kinase [Candidatus Woesearchaeota archaeon]
MKGTVIWFTGLSAAGKTTIAKAVSAVLKEKSEKHEILDGDILRKHITSDLGFSHEDREKNLARATFIAKLLARNNVIVLSAFITPYNSVRRKIRSELEGDSNFVEVYVKASLETCKKRCYKGLYAKAEKGIIKNFTGISDPFEEPENADLVLDTENKTIEECSEEVLKFIENLKN